MTWQQDDDTWQASVQDTWRHQDATRVMLIWHFWQAIGQYQGDTCHHSQGDTWHADVSMLTWQDTWQDCGSTAGHVAVTGRTVAVDVAHTWTNQVLTRVKLVKKGATWPTQGLPRGTPLLVGLVCLKNFGLARRGFRTRDLRAATT
jgi:hypothetical protein